LNELIRIVYPPVSPKRLFGDYENSDFNKNIRDYLLSIGYDQNNVFYYFTQNNWNSNTYFLGNYIFLGDDERKFFAQTTHEYLITQTQFNLYQGLTRGPNFLETTFNHPVYEVIWYLTQDNLDLSNDWYNFTGVQNRKSYEYYQSNLPFYSYGQYYQPILDYIEDYFDPTINSVQLPTVSRLTNIQMQTYFGEFLSIMENAQPVFNNNDRMEVQESGFYQNVQMFKYHMGFTPHGLYVLSFGLNPEDYQPSGTQNFSRLDYQEFRIRIYDTFEIEKKFNCYFYALNYNVLRVMGGMGNTVFSN